MLKKKETKMAKVKRKEIKENKKFRAIRVDNKKLRQMICDVFVDLDYKGYKHASKLYDDCKELLDKFDKSKKSLDLKIDNLSSGFVEYGAGVQKVYDEFKEIKALVKLLFKTNNFKEFKDSLNEVIKSIELCQDVLRNICNE